MATKDRITCHVLDTLTGRPAPGISVSLQLDPSQLGSIKTGDLPLYTWTAKTNADGRISNWVGTSKTGVGETVDLCVEPTMWTLTFDTGSYYGKGNTFWPEVQLKFFVKPGEHYHVPLLLGPYSYTTYRGS